MSEHSEGVSRRVVVGIDGSLGSHAAIRWAIDNAKSGDRIMLRHVWTASPSSLVIDRTDSTERSAAETFAARELARAGFLVQGTDISLSAEAVEGDAAQCLGECRCDLLVLGGCGHGRLSNLLLGSVSTHVVRHCRVPVVIVPCPASGAVAES